MNETLGEIACDAANTAPEFKTSACRRADMSALAEDIDQLIRVAAARVELRFRLFNILHPKSIMRKNGPERFRFSKRRPLFCNSCKHCSENILRDEYVCDTLLCVILFGNDRAVFKLRRRFAPLVLAVPQIVLMARGEVALLHGLAHVGKPRKVELLVEFKLALHAFLLSVNILNASLFEAVVDVCA